MEKRKINTDRERVSSEEIAENRDFNSVLSSFMTIKPAGKPFFKNGWFISGSSVVVVSIIVISVFTDIFKNRSNDKENISYVYSPGNENADEKAAFINPPFTGIDIEYEKYIVDAEKGGDLEYKTGSKIKVPEHAFTDENGNVIVGDVEIRYREFHKPLDFIVAGIPMTYDSAGVRRHFESAGMMEILAFQDGRQVYVNPDNLISVEMASDYSGTKYNLYSLDTVAKNWRFEGKDRVLKPGSGDEGITLSDQMENDNPVAQNRVHRDEPLFPEYYTSTEENIRAYIAEVKNEIAELEDEEPVKPRVASDDKYSFDLDVDAEEFPELAVYKGMKFEVADDSRFRADFYNIIWEEAVLEEAGDAGRYSLELRKGNEKYKFDVYPVFEGEGYEKALETYKSRFADYKKKLQERQAEEEKKEQELVKIMKKKSGMDSKMENEMKEAEKMLRQQKKRMAAFNTANKVLRAFQINGFGYWNCDNPLSFPAEKKLAALFADKQNSEEMKSSIWEGDYLEFIKLYLIEKDRNAIFTVDLNKLDKFTYNPKKENMIIGVTKENLLAVFPYHHFESVPKRAQAYTFEMKVYKKHFNHISEIQDLMDNNFETDKELSENKQDNGAEMKVFPNPFIDNITVRTNISGQYTIQLISMSGSVVREDMVSGQENQLALGYINTGTYILRILSGDKQVLLTERIVKNT